MPSKPDFPRGDDPKKSELPSTTFPRKGLSLPLESAPLPITAGMGQSGVILEIIRWAERFSPLKLNFDDLGGIQQDVPALKADDAHEMHVCGFCLHAKEDPARLLDCRRNKHAVNWLIRRRLRGLMGHCHLGLFDIAEPLMIEGRVLGVFYFGSVLVKGQENLSRERILRYCSKKKIDPKPYLKLSRLTPQIAPEDIGGYRDFLRALAALATQCCLAAGIRAEDYKPMSQGIKYRPHDELPYLVKAALRYAHEHLHEPFTVKDIAAHVRCHPNFLSKQFKLHLKVELATYAGRLRINHAVQLMANPKLSISQVADESGFSDRVYFGKVFRRTTGMTPGQYRQHLIDTGAFPKAKAPG